MEIFRRQQPGRYDVLIIIIRFSDRPCRARSRQYYNDSATHSGGARVITDGGGGGPFLALLSPWQTTNKNINKNRKKHY